MMQTNLYISKSKRSKLLPKIHDLGRKAPNNERKLPCRFSSNTALGLMKSEFDLIPVTKLGL